MLAECARMLWRRRIWVAVAILLASAAGVAAFMTVKPGQESKAQVLFIGSIKQPGVQGPTNPYTNLGGSLAVVASVVQVGVTDAKTAQQIYAQGSRAAYSVEPNLAENAGPVLLVTVDDKSSDMVQRTLTAVLTEIKSQLRSLQVERGVDPSLFVTSQVLTASAHPLPVHKAQIQKSVIAAFATLAILLAVILLLERRRIRRARTRTVSMDQRRDTDDKTPPTAPRSVEPPSLPPPARRSRMRGTRSDQPQGASGFDGNNRRTPPRPTRRGPSPGVPPDASRP